MSLNYASTIPKPDGLTPLESLLYDAEYPDICELTFELGLPRDLYVPDVIYKWWVSRFGTQWKLGFDDTGTFWCVGNVKIRSSELAARPLTQVEQEQLGEPLTLGKGEDQDDTAIILLEGENDED